MKQQCQLVFRVVCLIGRSHWVEEQRAVLPLCSSEDARVRGQSALWQGTATPQVAGDDILVQAQLAGDVVERLGVQIQDGDGVREGGRSGGEEVPVLPLTGETFIVLFFLTAGHQGNHDLAVLGCHGNSVLMNLGDGVLQRAVVLTGTFMQLLQEGLVVRPVHLKTSSLLGEVQQVLLHAAVQRVKTFDVQSVQHLRLTNSVQNTVAG